MRWNRPTRKAGASRTTRQPAIELLDSRYLLAVDVLGLPEVAPVVERFLDDAVMGELQQWAGETGVNPESLFSIRALHHPLDVSLDGVISPVDPLMVISQLNAHGPRETSESSWRELGRFDVNDDSIVSAADVLSLIRGINDRVGESGNWWKHTDGPNALAADLLDLVRDDMAGRATDEIVAHLNYVRELVLDHVDHVRRAVAEDLQAGSHDLDVDAIETRVEAIRDLVDEHLNYLEELLDRHIAELPTPEIAPAPLSEGEASTEEDTFRLHADYIRDLIDSHIEYVRAGVPLDEIDDLIGTHADYLSKLLEIHHVDVGDASHFGHIVEELSQGLGWLEGLGLHDANRLGLPASVADVWNTAWNHVGYVGDLIEQHEGVFAQDIDWSATITSHIDLVQDVLRLHGLHV